MSLAATRVSLTQRTTIERNSAVADAWGNEGTPDWAVAYSGVTCRAWNDAGREAVAAERTVVVIDFRCIVPPGTDVTEDDRLGDITERGVVIFEGPFAIEAVLRRGSDHLELVLEEYR